MLCRLAFLRLALNLGEQAAAVVVRQKMVMAGRAEAVATLQQRLL